MQISVTITALEQGDKPPADLDRAAGSEGRQGRPGDSGTGGGGGGGTIAYGELTTYVEIAGGVHTDLVRRGRLGTTAPRSGSSSSRRR